MKQPPAEQTLHIPLYHGTSTLFLNSITKFGLGGRNPITEWKILEFAKVIFPVVEKHLAVHDDWMAKVQSFKWMVEQKSAAMNFQHGNTYVSPSHLTAIRYAIHKRYGSELLTYTLDFLNELVRLKVDGVCDQLYRAYPHIFEKLDISAAPLLVQIDSVAPKAIILAGLDSGNVYGGIGPNGFEMLLFPTARSCLERGALAIVSTSVFPVTAPRDHPVRSLATSVRFSFAVFLQPHAARFERRNWRFLTSLTSSIRNPIAFVLRFSPVCSSRPCRHRFGPNPRALADCAPEFSVVRERTWMPFGFRFPAVIFQNRKNDGPDPPKNSFACLGSGWPR